MEKLMILFGGRSSEHEVSCRSALNVIRSVDTDRYELLLTGITKDGRWLLADSVAGIEDGTWTESRKSSAG